MEKRHVKGGTARQTYANLRADAVMGRHEAALIHHGYTLSENFLIVRNGRMIPARHVTPFGQPAWTVTLDAFGFPVQCDCPWWRNSPQRGVLWACKHTYAVALDADGCAAGRTILDDALLQFRRRELDAALYEGSQLARDELTAEDMDVLDGVLLRAAIRAAGGYL